MIFAFNYAGSGSSLGSGGVRDKGARQGFIRNLKEEKHVVRVSHGSPEAAKLKARVPMSLGVRSKDRLPFGKVGHAVAA
jgi:hypothetical protein